MVDKVKQFCKRYWLLLPVLLFLVVWSLYAQGDIGISKQAMLEEQGKYLKEGKGDYLPSASIGESMASFLSYSIEEDDYDLRIYVKRQNTIGWFFRYGRSGGAENYLVEYSIEGNNEYVLTYLSPGTQGNTPAVSYIAVDKGNGTTMTITPEANTPFAYVLDLRWSVAVYAADGSMLQPIQRSL